MIGPDELVDIGPAMLGQVIAGRKNSQLIHNMEFTGKTEQVN
jgi:hypothetical protein